MSWFFGLAAGHPSRRNDDGTPNRGAEVPGMVEADETMSWCRYIHRHVVHAHEPFDTFLVRDLDDEVVGLTERAERSAKAQCDLVVSVHINAWHTERLRGSTAFYFPGDETGKHVADTMLRCMPEPLCRPGRVAMAADPSDPQDAWLNAPAAVLGPYAKQGIPAALLEVGYMTNGDDFRAMRDPSIQFGVLCAVLAGFACARTMINGACHEPFGG